MPPNNKTEVCAEIPRFSRVNSKLDSPGLTAGDPLPKHHYLDKSWRTHGKQLSIREDYNKPQKQFETHRSSENISNNAPNTVRFKGLLYASKIFQK